MRNFTFNLSRFSRHIFLIVFLLICTYNASAQFYTKHYIAPAPWQYFSKANEIVIATNSTTPVTIEILKSDGTLITNSLTASKGSPAVYRFAGLPKDAPALKLNTVINAAGLIVTGSKPISINLRNIASDALGGEGSDKDIKGNAALTSFGDAGIGIRYRIGYYRDGSLGNFGGYGDQRPIYSIMAITNGTSVKFNSTLITLNAGQSYLFTAPIGTLVESSNPTVMNTSAAIDTPDGCGDGAYNQIPPEAVLGTEYFIQRGKGNDTAEQTTVVATKANTKVTVDTFSATGVLTGTIEKTLLNAGDFFTFGNGISKTNFSASRVFATNTVAVYSGTARDCEVDVYTIAPVSQCGGSNFIETAKFRNYGVGSLPYFGYVLLKDASSKVYVNGQDIETKSGISARRQLGNTGWYLINFEDTQIGSPDVLSLSSDAKLTVSIVQQGGGFTMAGFFSNFAVQPEDPTFNYISGGGCTNNSALLKTQTGLSPYQWYLNGVAIAGANSDTYTATKTGSYSVASTLTCGAQTQSKPVSVTLCTDLGITKTVDNATPCVGSNVEFTVKLSNLGGNNSTGVSVNDLLPTGYTFVSSTQTTGNYNATTGVWSIGDVNGGATETLKIIAKVNASGVYTNTASLPSTTTDSNAANNSASVSTTPNPLPTLTINNPASVCSPSTVDLTSSTVTAGSSSNLTFTYWTNSAATAAYATPTAATAGTYYIKATNSFGCSVIKSVVVTVATPPNSGVLSGVQNICTAGTSNFTSNGNTGGVWTSNNTSIATVNSSTGLVTGVSSGTATITYKVTGTGGCSDAVSIRTITVTTAPNAGTLSGTQNICIGGTSTFSSSGDTGGAWTSDNTSIATVNSSTGVVTGVSSGTATITYKVIGTGGCSDVTSTRTITVNPTPIAPTASAQSFCSADNKTVNDLTVTTGSNLKWYTQLTGGNALASTDILTTRTYYVSQTSASGCESSRTSVDVTINPTPVAPTASAQLFCSADNKTINDLTVTTGSNLKWYTQLTGGSSLASTDILTTRTYYVSQATNTCESARTSVSVIVTTTPSTPILSNITQPTCSTFTGSFTINNYDSTYNYIITPSTGVINNAGTITAPTGSYTISASINGCSSGNVSFVINSILCANADSFGTKTSGSSAVNIGNVKTNDTLNGLAVTAANTSVTPKTDGVLSVDADGEVTLSADAPSGSYSITYEICEKNTANCKTATATVDVVNGLVANADSFGTKTSGSSAVNIGNVKTNDTLNGLAVTAANTSVTPKTDGVLSVDADGEVTLSADTPSGSYSITYEICEKNTANCKTATATVVVDNKIKAVVDTIIPINGNIGGTTVVLTANDTLNGNPVVIGTNSGEVSINIVGTLPTGLTLNSNGTITVSPSTPKGDYNVEYVICEVGAVPANCDSVTIVVPVTSGDLVANPDTVPSVIGSNANQTLNVNVLDNDTKNGRKLDPSDVNLTVSKPDPKGYLILNPDGTLTLGANAPAGNYELEYTICEKLNPSNCKSNTVTVTVTAPKIEAVADPVTSINGNIGGTTISLTANDKLNGNPAVVGTASGEVSFEIIGTLPSGFTLNPDHTITVAPNTPAGDYNVEYRICENTNPTNCDSVISIVTVTSGDLVANPDTVPSVIGSNANQTLNVNVLDNDTKNGQKLDPSDVNLTVSKPDPKGYLVLNPDGTLTLGANAPAGNYELEYTICEKLNPSNCKSNTVTVTVTAPKIEAVADPVTSINGNIGGTTISLTANDKLNGNPAVVGTSSGEVSFEIIGTLPSGFTLNPDHTITVAPNTPAGDYNVEYRICENTNPTNCDSVISIVTVTSGDLVANPDTVPSVIGSNANQTLNVNVLENDTKNGQKLDPSDVNLTVSKPDPKGYLVLNPDGTLTLGANAPAGNYELEYTICEKLNPSNCKSNTVTVTVTAPKIEAVADPVTSINGNTGGTTISLTANDKLNGNPAVVGTASGEVSFEIIGTLPSGFTLNPDHTITVAPNTPAGDYNVEYRICENTNPTNCDSVISIVTVTSGDLVANPDTVPSVIGSNANQTLNVNVLDNDTKNGQKLDPSDVNLTVSKPDPKGYLVLNPDGTLTLGANAPAGNYELEYTICEKLNPSNCKSNTVTVTVTAPKIEAVADPVTSINGNIGGTTISLTANDKLNGNPAVVGTSSGEVSFEIIGTLPSGFTLNPDHTITVAPNTPAGDYNVEYRICENTNPTNCDSVISIVTVTSGDLVANPDTVPSVIGSNANQTLNVNVLENDTKNGQKLDPSDVNLTVSKPDPKGYLVLNPDGTLTLGANAPAGNYELEYTICEKLNPSNCKSNTVTVTVTAPKIEAVADPVTSINGNTGGTTISLTANDKLNGNPAVVGTASGEVSFEIIGTLPSGFTLNPDHTITVAPNTPAGDYNVEYRICENTNPTNCDSVISIVTVTSGDLVANPDTVPSVIGSNANQTLNVNVLDNDTKNGQKLDPSDVNLTVSKPDPKGYLVLNPDGTLTLGANAPAGNYELEYTICEKLNPSNCKSNTVTVTVTAPKIEAVADPVTSINGNIGGTTISLTANDKLNGNPAVVGTSSGEVSFEIIGTLPSGFTLNPDHTITVAPNTPAGNYNVEYRICENTNPTNCDSVISVVTVTGGDLVANEDLVPSAVGVNVSQTVINVFTNDTKNGNALVPSDVNLTLGTDPKGYLTIDANGNVILAPNAPVGDYELPYTICEKLNPSNCSSNVVKVTVTEPKMTVSANSYCSNNVPYVNYTVTPDNFTTANLLTVKWIDSANNVVATQTNLPLSGNIIWPGAIVDGSGNGVDWPGWILNNGQWTEGADGFELTRNGVKMEFSLNPTVTVSVAYPAATSGCNARPTFSIKANNDEAGPIDVKKGMNASLNIFANDLVNGVNPNPSDVILSTVVANPNLTLNTDGSINIAANTPNGVYELTYQICEAANTSNCSQATIKITVLNTLDPASPASNEITLGNDNNISVDGINGSLEFVNVLDNDLINGQPINPADVVVKPLTTNAYFEWNADGTVNVKPNTPGGNYPLTYQVCEKADPLNCSTAVMNVFVEVPAIAVIKTAVFNDEDKSGYANAGETITYKFTVTNTGNVPLIGITITDPLTGVVVSGQPIDLNVNESNETNFTAVYKITQEDINLGSVSNQAIAQGKSSRGVVVEDKSDDSSNNGDNPTVLDLNGCAIKVFKAFSPNGDEKNARFFIRGIECYPDNTVEIYNRWGVLVFSIDQYNNTDRVFLGYSNGRSTIKQTDGLPVGTYFYILKYKDSAKNPHEESGYLYINK